MLFLMPSIQSFATRCLSPPSSTCPETGASDFEDNYSGKLWITNLDSFIEAFHQLEASTNADYVFTLDTCFKTYLARHKIYAKVRACS